MKIFKELGRQVFTERFTTDQDFYEFLADLKWREGFSCEHCDPTAHIKGKQLCSRSCSKLGCDESTTAGTPFHKLRFDTLKAFETLYEITTSKKGANSIWLTELFDLNQKTTWALRQKVQLAMKSSEQYPLEDEVYVGEFEIGTPQKGEQRRSKSDKKMRAVIAFEHREGKSGRGYGRVIKDYSAKSLKPLFNRDIKNDASILADGWRGYSPLKNVYPDLKQTLSDQRKNLKMLHIQIRNFKNWLRSVHRRNHRASILDKIIERCAMHEPVTACELRLIAA